MKNGLLSWKASRRRMRRNRSWGEGAGEGIELMRASNENIGKTKNDPLSVKTSSKRIRRRRRPKSGMHKNEVSCE